MLRRKNRKRGIQLKTYSSRPSIQTGVTPNQIIGSANNLEIIKEHLKMTLSNNGEFPEGKVFKAFDTKVRTWIAETYHNLRENGLYPVGIDKNGNISWKIAMECPVYREVIDTMPDTPETRVDTDRMISKVKAQFGAIGG